MRSQGLNDPRQRSVSTTAAALPGCLEKPLVIRAAIIRRPEFFGQNSVADAMAEEGDILFSALKMDQHLYRDSVGDTSCAAESLDYDNFGLQPVLCLPPTVESYYEGEFFKALVSIVNVATYGVREVQVEVDGYSPSKSKHVLCRQSLSELEAKAAFTKVVEFPLRELGKHTLEVKCRSVDPAGHKRELSWSTDVVAAVGVQEEFSPIARRVAVPIFDPLTVLQCGKEDLYSLDVSVKNCTSSFLTITSCFLDLPARSPYCVVSARDNAEEFPTELPGNFFRMSPLYRFSLPPGERQHFTFYLSIPTAALRQVPTKIAGKDRLGVITSTYGEVGTLRWSWQRHKGDGGSATSKRIWLTDFIAPPTVDLLLQSVRTPCCALGSQTLWLQGYVVVYEGTVTLDRVDPELAIKVRPELLAPAWLYCGPTLLALADTVESPIEKTVAWSFRLPLIPWRSGELAIRKNAFEIVKANDPQQVIWPAPPAWTQEKSSIGAGRMISISLEAPHPTELLALVSVA